jgi:predicted DNA-binding protein
MKTIAIRISEEQAARLKDEQRRSGAPVSLQVRRALDAQAQRDQKTDEKVAENA